MQARRPIRAIRSASCRSVLSSMPCPWSICSKASDARDLSSSSFSWSVRLIFRVGICVSAFGKARWASLEEYHDWQFLTITGIRHICRNLPRTGGGHFASFRRGGLTPASDIYIRSYLPIAACGSGQYDGHGRIMGARRHADGAGKLFSFSGCSSAWLERLVWDQKAAGSNPVTPTSETTALRRTSSESCFWFGAKVLRLVRTHSAKSKQPAELGCPVHSPARRVGEPVRMAAAAELRIRVASTWPGMARRTAAASAAASSPEGMGSAISTRPRSR
jgi:hypothetical protein